MQQSLELLPGRARQEKGKVALSELHAADGSRLVVVKIVMIRDRHNLILWLKLNVLQRYKIQRRFARNMAKFRC